MSSLLQASARQHKEIYAKFIFRKYISSAFILLLYNGLFFPLALDPFGILLLLGMTS